MSSTRPSDFPPIATICSPKKSSVLREISSGTPFVKRVIASLKIPWRIWVLRKLYRLKVALSTKMRVVVSSIAVDLPPIAPASATAISPFAPVAITMSFSLIFIVLPSKSSNSSSSKALRTVIFTFSLPFSATNLSKSKVCSGWPISSIKKLARSVTASIGRIPERSK